MPSQQLVKELQMILKDEYGLDFGFQKASKIAREFTDAFDLLAEINYENIDNKNKN